MLFTQILYFNIKLTLKHCGTRVIEKYQIKWNIFKAVENFCLCLQIIIFKKMFIKNQLTLSLDWAFVLTNNFRPEPRIPKNKKTS